MPSTTGPTRSDTWEALGEACAELGDEDLRVLVVLARRLGVGQRCYGRLDLANDARDFRKERAEELEDLLVYTAIGELARVVRGSP